MNIHLTSYGQGYPLVFFHGWGFDHQIWLPLIPALSETYQVILVDLPGFGLSSIMDWYHFKLNLLALLPKQFALIGWSMGGLYATRLAIEEPERVSHLFNITTSPRFITDSSWPGVPKELFVTFNRNLSRDLNGTLREFMALQLNKSKVNFVPGNPPTLQGLNLGLDMLETWDLRRDLKNLKQPTCFLFGRLDSITPVKTMNAMEITYPEFKYILFKKAAHLPFLSHPQEFIEELKGFVR